MKLLRIYIITVIVVASITAFTASLLIAHENARRITLGENSPVVSVSEIINYFTQK